MTARFGIELAPNACRIIGIDRPAAWSRQAGDTRVLSFDLLPASASETRDTLRSLRRPTAAVVVWTPSEHRQVVVTGGSYESMRAEALDALAAAGVQTERSEEHTSELQSLRQLVCSLLLEKKNLDTIESNMSRTDNYHGK